MWFTYLLHDIGLQLSKPPTLFCDNLSALYLTINPILHARTKHVELDYHFIREQVAKGSLITQFVPSTAQIADVFTKPLPTSTFTSLCRKLSVLSILPLRLRGNVKPCDQITPTAQNDLVKSSSQQSPEPPDAVDCIK